MTEPVKRRGRRIGLFLLLCLLALGAVAAYLLHDRYTGFADAPLAGVQAGQTFVVERGDSFQRVLGRLREAGIEDGHIVIHEGKIEYPLPVVDDAMAICSAPSPEAWERFESIYRRRGRSRLELHSRILASDGRDAVRFTGQFVLHK